jgi:hypothetical protein
MDSHNMKAFNFSKFKPEDKMHEIRPSPSQCNLISAQTFGDHYARQPSLPLAFSQIEMPKMQSTYAFDKVTTIGNINVPPKINTVGQFLRDDFKSHGPVKSIPSINEFLNTHRK